MEKIIFEAVNDTPEMFEVSAEKMYELASSCDLLNLSERSKSTLVVYKKKYYIVTGVHYKGNNKGIELVNAYEVLSEKLYKRDLPPLFYHEHWAAVANNKREQGFAGMKFFYKKNIFVMTKPVQFVEDNNIINLTLKLF